jgi:hypothetical protein
MEGALLYIKHNLFFLWALIENLNGVLFSFKYGSVLDKTLGEIVNDPEHTYEFRRLIAEDTKDLFYLINSQDEYDLRYFSPHGFDLISLQRIFKNHAFLPMGVFCQDKMVGYFFLRFFITGKCFVGRLIDRDYRGKGIGLWMNKIMYETAWKMGFRCLSTISKNNSLVMKAHSRNNHMVILKELQNDYLLVEFIKE